MLGKLCARPLAPDSRRRPPNAKPAITVIREPTTESRKPNAESQEPDLTADTCYSLSGMPDPGFRNSQGGSRTPIARCRNWQYHELMNLGFSEMVFLFLLALLIFGPKKLPEIGRQIGRALNEFKRASNEFRSQIESEIANLEREPSPQILPPARAPEGTVSSAPQLESSSAEPASNSVVKAPDA